MLVAEKVANAWPFKLRLDPGSGGFVVQTTKDHLGTSFPPAVRLQCPSDYKRALQGRRLSRGVLFVFHTPKTPSPEQTTARDRKSVGVGKERSARSNAYRDKM